MRRSDDLSSDTADCLIKADALLAEGRARDALELLAAANGRTPDPILEQRLIAVRHAAVAKMPPPPIVGEAVSPIMTDPFADEGIPELPASELTAENLDAALRYRGSLLVRGLLTATVADGLLNDVERTFEAAAAAEAGAPVCETTPWYAPFEAEDAYSFDGWDRAFAQQVGSVLSVDAPRTFVHVIDALLGAGLYELLNDYFGESPLLSAKKSSLRRATPASPTEWHQDGAFLGTGTRAVNAWVALSPCGTQAPGVDVVAHAFDNLVETGTDDALFDWSVSRAAADRTGAGRVMRPQFEPGDALLFNQLTLHRTGVERTMTRDRYAIESWFFALSTYPYEQVPLLF